MVKNTKSTTTGLMTIVKALKTIKPKKKLFQEVIGDPNDKDSEKLKANYFEALKEFNKLKRYTERNYWKLKKR